MFKTTVKIDGMMCGMCESHINDKIRNTFNVKSVSSSHTSGESIIISEKHIDPSAIKKAITDIGYEYLDSSEEPYEKKGFFSKLFK